ncbi:signal peptidase I [Actinokineospora baliensis]|uniref:signal peptidase I n=1 Tax=Actinokineospora baliensis TaxID=547056 RepID=UPI0027DB0B26|nr:signal peptidase I [Actinokineospora baliensis]MBM7772847.1 signal peptidase I [Actinokineospora baliensis]
MPGDGRGTEDLDVIEPDTTAESGPPRATPDTGSAERTEQADTADGGEPAKPEKKKRPFWVELPILIGVALVLTIIIQSFIARVFVIPSESMEQTLHGCPGCSGDRILVDRVVYYFRDPEPGDVVVFERPDTWDADGPVTRSDNAAVAWLQDFGSQFGLAEPSNEDVVKRVIAVAGQTVECCDAEQRVLVDGKPLDEPYINRTFGPNEDQLKFAKITLPPGMLWVMGDNRNFSADSRIQGGGKANGFVPVDNVIGKARYIILPPSRWRGVGDHNPQALAVPAWQAGLPAGIGIAAAWPTLWLGRRLRGVLVRGVLVRGHGKRAG